MCLVWTDWPLLRLSQLEPYAPPTCRRRGDPQSHDLIFHDNVSRILLEAHRVVHRDVHLVTPARGEHVRQEIVRALQNLRAVAEGPVVQHVVS